MSAPVSTAAPVRVRNSTRKVAAASFVGTAIEWYDFYIYGTASALILGPLFFPGASASGGVLASFATYAVGFLARPLGGAIAGHLGDRIGRKRVLVASLLLMGTATFLVGFLPTYATIGIAAPLLLILLRLLQGLSAGSEWGGAVLLAVEHAPAKRRGLYGAIPQTGSAAGMILATSTYAGVQALVGHEAFLSWGWRIPFIASAVLVVVGLIVRLSITESAEFLALRDEDRLEKAPVVEVFRSNSREVLLAVAMRLGQIGSFTLYTVFALTYLANHVRADGADIGLVATIIASVIGLASTPLWGALSDRLGRRPVYLFGAIFTAVFVAPAFLLLDTGSSVLIIVTFILGINIGHDSQYGAQGAMFSELFPTQVRYSGASLGYAIGAVLGGGLTPLAAAWLLGVGANAPWLVAAYIAFLAVLSATGAYFAKETRHVTPTPTTPESPNELVGAR
ncbi:metabolite-proton symporter [Antricoccus suffuscus]|uniref:Putative proline/betaine transporter n=1 Tax=Antricoccus suffuscus TaxID=1629062 RepID=A0A2T1A107_9ACTN|nr:MFS transporter [Antricoccus suffuscus]PRZ42286.1 metabolite-proton symporter [Antricoccus suffuscus]